MKKIILAFFAFALIIEIFAMFAIIIANERIDEIIPAKKWIFSDFVLMIITYTIGAIFYKITNKNK